MCKFNAAKWDCGIFKFVYECVFVYGIIAQVIVLLFYFGSH